MSNRQQVANLLIQVILGIIFLAHGMMKFQSGLDGIAQWFASIGLPGMLAYIVAFIEVIGGIFLIIGLGVPYIGMLFTIVMAGAIIKAKLPFGLLGDGTNSGYEFELALLAMSLYLAVANVKGFVDQRIGKKRGHSANL
ncbi:MULTISPECIES: DoxX family protein [Aneurinibacillus]|uniref:DoxX family protein n=1 Tax=Aneurinibacillus thermoaerophilus TaxID=143495 RepID=A0A1G7YNG2_ANETH|nr:MULTISPECIES: DoxX family protein [Aneurinibacillus]AMA73786.1 hypothetical protein ACH33_13590 [Aneurinibacillus sp. XH2]MED0677143.1 DoxX family protein [Aneurinibacillus thermoaerophilus]MED0679397.1 DoxX family protein [Aneurinibacillus thermoaerophilus]MED0738032.1 DoxX family protein [Aneurinibacillus thermoaerophilus]MED0756453.1 DoxX family protein [Aneurinibacillus thermoaerophilus]